MERQAELLRLDFAQMLYDGGWVEAVEHSLDDSQRRSWLRSDDAQGLSLDLGLRHFTRLKLLASLRGSASVELVRKALRRDIYPQVAVSTAKQWMAAYQAMLQRWICPLPGVVVGAKPGEEPPLWVPPPAHRWEELLRDVELLVSAVSAGLGERAVFRGLNFWLTELHRLNRWPTGWERLRGLCDRAWARDDMESNRVFTYADYFGSVLGAQLAREFGGALRFTTTPGLKLVEYDRDGVAEWMEDHLYGRLHASLAALTATKSGDVLRRAATLPESVTDDELAVAFRTLRHYTAVHLMGHLAETFGTMMLKLGLNGTVPDDVCFIPGQAIWVKGKGGKKQGPDGLLARIEWLEPGGLELEVIGIVEVKAYQVSSHKLLSQIEQHKQRMTAGRVTLLTMVDSTGERVWHGRAEMGSTGATSEVPVSDILWPATVRRIAVVPSSAGARRANPSELEIIEMPWTQTGFRRMGWRMLAWYGENLGRTADPNDYELGRSSWISCVERLMRSRASSISTRSFLPELLDTLQTTGRDPDEADGDSRLGWAWAD